MKRVSVLIVALTLSSTSGCLSGGGSVTRLVGGREIDSRPIGVEAYALYAQGLLEQRQGELTKAHASFEQALSYDPDSPELWTRLGAVSCAQGQSPDAAFSRARQLDASYAPVYREQARCALTKKRSAQALRDARKSVDLDPDDEEAVGLLIEALSANGQRDRALRWALSTAVEAPERTAHWQRLEKLARRSQDQPLLALAQRRARASQATPADLSCGPGHRDDLDAELQRGRLDPARAIALRCRMTAGELALRAAALGNHQVARVQAEMVLAADPGNSDALIAQLLAGGPVHADVPTTEPSPLATLLLAELLARRVGPDAARTFLRARGELPPASDDLDQRTRERVLGALADQ